MSPWPFKILSNQQQHHPLDCHPKQGLAVAEVPSWSTSRCIYISVDIEATGCVETDLQGSHCVETCIQKTTCRRDCQHHQTNRDVSAKGWTGFRKTLRRCHQQIISGCLIKNVGEIFAESLLIHNLQVHMFVTSSCFFSFFCCGCVRCIILQSLWFMLYPPLMLVWYWCLWARGKGKGMQLSQEMTYRHRVHRWGEPTWCVSHLLLRPTDTSIINRTFAVAECWQRILWFDIINCLKHGLGCDTIIGQQIRNII